MATQLCWILAPASCRLRKLSWSHWGNCLIMTCFFLFLLFHIFSHALTIMLKLGWQHVANILVNCYHHSHPRVVNAWGHIQLQQFKLWCRTKTVSPCVKRLVSRHMVPELVWTKYRIHVTQRYTKFTNRQTPQQKEGGLKNKPSCDTVLHAAPTTRTYAFS